MNRTKRPWIRFSQMPERWKRPPYPVEVMPIYLMRLVPMTSDLCSLPYPWRKMRISLPRPFSTSSKDAAGRIRLGLDLQGEVSFTVAMETNVISADRNRQEVMEQAIGVLRSRVDKFGVAEPVLQTRGENEITIEMPGLSELTTSPSGKSSPGQPILSFAWFTSAARNSWPEAFLSLAMKCSPNDERARLLGKPMLSWNILLSASLNRV